MKAVLLDALGTLVRLRPPAPALRARLSASTGVDIGEAAARRGFEAEIAYYLAHHHEGADERSLGNLRDRCAAVMHAAIAVDGPTVAQVREAMIDALTFEAYEDVVPALEGLRRRGMTLVAVSNWDCSLAHWLEQAGVAALMDGAVSSAQAGAPKPDPAPFVAALELAGVGPADAVHVGDSLEADVAGARAAGIEAIHLDRSDRDAAGGVVTVRSLAELGALL